MVMKISMSATQWVEIASGTIAEEHLLRTVVLNREAKKIKIERNKVITSKSTRRQ
jgi:hypothetical protein